MLGLSYASRLSPRLESELATLFTPSPSRVGHPGDPYNQRTKAWVPPSPSPKAKKQSTKVGVPPPPPPRKRNPPKKKEKPPAPKLAYLMTQEELDESVAKHVKGHFAPKKAPPK